MEDTTFELVETFEYDKKTFCKFINISGKYAYLNIDENNKFYYPKMEDLVELVNLQMIDPEVLYALDDKLVGKKYKFTPKVWFKGVLMVLTASLLLSACGKKQSTNNRDYSNNTTYYEKNVEDDTHIGKDDKDEKDRHYDELIINTDNNYEEYVENEYDFDNSISDTTSNVSTQPETYDSIYNRIKDMNRNDIINQKYKWDYEITIANNNKSVLECMDHNFNKVLLGYDMPSKEVLFNTIDSNKNINDYYKQLFKQWITNWLNKYPGTDFTILNENLKTLQIQEMEERAMQKEAHSLSALACYVFGTNSILVNKDADKNSDEFMYIFFHETSHVARIKRIYGDTKSEYYNFGFNPSDGHFLYTDESLATLFTSMENEGGLYRFICNCYRIIIEASNYTGKDYINHSPYEFGAKIDYSLSDITTGKDLLLGMENVGKWIYDPVEKAKLKLDDVHNVLKTVIKIYLKLHPEATFEEVENALMKDVDPTISKYQELFKDDALNKIYYKAIDEMGISKTR